MMKRRTIINKLIKVRGACDEIPEIRCVKCPLFTYNNKDCPGWMGGDSDNVINQEIFNNAISLFLETNTKEDLFVLLL